MFSKKIEMIRILHWPQWWVRDIVRQFLSFEPTSFPFTCRRKSSENKWALIYSKFRQIKTRKQPHWSYFATSTFPFVKQILICTTDILISYSRRSHACRTKSKFSVRNIARTVSGRLYDGFSRSENGRRVVFRRSAQPRLNHNALRNIITLRIDTRN